MASLDGLLDAFLDRLEAAHAYRRLHASRPDGAGAIWRDGRRLINFSSNDYLGLSLHPALIARARQWTERWGAGSRASRLVCGTLEAHQEIEAKLARLKGTEAALVFNSGFQANGAVLPALFDRELLKRDPLVFADRLNHASLHHGCRAAGVRQIRFRHNDMNHLESLLKANTATAGLRFILTESVFSMDGDRADMEALASLAARHDAFLYLDEAHATGVLGPRGMGLAGEIPGKVDLVMGTFSKALGGFGAYVACSAKLREYLINTCAGFIYSTALPPAVLGAIDAALDLVPGMDADRERLLSSAERVRTAFKRAGIDTAGSSTQIVPALVGAEQTALALSRDLEADGILGIAIRPPTVPAGTSRIRFALTADHGVEDVDRLIATLPALAETHGLLLDA